ncbi:polysaccharide biosynthesis protein GtrA [Parazoarcus communis]|uniref:Polysaccharide biosynthesis protein GtrA n=1 Tax=Parazoarcus communis TaxID=41977 RepID=A0A2U8GQ35_9RHOO|nr:GtrA family protein [Parazoarcus communis]AWI75772.1 polysaccharide biosynthesis protein GtrA [Parazoarcus communis]
MIARAELIRFARFAAVGLVGTIAHYALLLALVEIGSVPPLAGSVAGFLLGAMVNYAINHRFVFRSGRAHAEALPRFMTVAGVGLCWNALLMYLLAELMGLHYLLAQILTTGLLLVWHYVGNAVWTFRRDKAGGV